MKSVKINLRILFASALVLGCICPSQAQSFYTPGGLFLHPTALLPKQGTTRLTLSYLFQDESDESAMYIPATLSYSPSNKFVIGALGVEHIMHMKATESNIGNSGGDGMSGGITESLSDSMDDMPSKTHQHYGGFFQYQLIPDAVTHPAFSVGASYAHDDLSETTVSGAFSHTFFRPGGRTSFVGHLGLKWARTPFGDTGQAAYAGIEVPVSRDIRFIGEAATKMGFDKAGAHGFGFVWKRPGAVNIGAGIVNVGRGSSEGFYWGVGYPLGGGS